MKYLIAGFIFTTLLKCSNKTWAFSENTIETIRIATPEWPSQTNKDLSGLYFEIIRAIYPEDLFNLEIEFVPWMRASKYIYEGKADLMFASYKGRVDAYYPYMPLDFEDVCAYARDEKTKPPSPSTKQRTAVSYVRGYDYNHYLNIDKNDKITVFEVGTEEHGLDMLFHDRVNHYIGTCADTELLLNENTDYKDKNIFSYIMYKKPLFLRFSKLEKNIKLMHRYDQEFTKLVLSGKIDELFAKYNMKYDKIFFNGFIKAKEYNYN